MRGSILWIAVWGALINIWKPDIFISVFPHGHKFDGTWETFHDFFFFFLSHSAGRLIPDQVKLLFDKSLQVLISIDK